jgi:hypothetical protein
LCGFENLHCQRWVSGFGLFVGNNFHAIDQANSAHIADEGKFLQGLQPVKQALAQFTRTLWKFFAFHDLNIFQRHSTSHCVT